MRSITRKPFRAPRIAAGTARTACALAFAALALRVLGVRGARGLLRRMAEALPAAPLPAGRAEAAGRWMGRRIAAVAERMPGRPRCLARSLVLWSALRRRGVDAQLRLGVALAGGFAAHAWVEVAGEAVNDAPDVAARYAPFAPAAAGG